MINSVYEKTMEKLRKRISVRLLTNEKDLLQYISTTTHITHTIFDKDFDDIHETKKVLIPKKPIYVGFTV